MGSVFAFIQNFSQRPLRVLAVCGFAIFVMVVTEGTLWQLWNLHRQEQKMDENLVELNNKYLEIYNELQLAKDPKYVEQRARDQFDLANKGELVFVFTQ